MKRATILVWLVAQCCLTNGEDIRKKVRTPEVGPALTTTIDPEKHIFGIPFETSEEDFIKRVGKPDGYIHLAGNDSAMIYGKDIAFLFHLGKLAGVQISVHGVLDWDLGERMPANGAFGQIATRWKLDNGIQNETPLSKVKEILGEKFTSEKGFRPTYITRTAAVRFGVMTKSGHDLLSGQVCGVTVEKAR